MHLRSNRQTYHLRDLRLAVARSQAFRDYITEVDHHGPVRLLDRLFGPIGSLGQGVTMFELYLSSPVTLGRFPFAGVVNQDLTRQPRSHADEVHAVPQIDRLAAGQPELGLVNQSRALQGVIRAFGLQVVVREPTQLLVDQND
ncbi:MAG: hypothetical protein WB762_31565 [Candidatus Sulfotelmatobacter sp.]